MIHSYRQFIGRPYEPPHGCLRLVQQIFAECYGVDLSALSAELSGDPPGIRAIHECLMRHTVRVDDPREGDIAWIRAEPWHVGVVIEPPEMIHSYAPGATSVCERYTTHDVRGFYRYRGFA